MNSMTGFGKAEQASRLGKFTVEISSVNNRYLEIAPRLPRQFFGLEAQLRDLVGTVISRGKIHLYVGFDESKDSPGKYAINKDAAKALHTQLMEVRRSLKIENDVTIRDLLLLPEVTAPEKVDIDDKQAWEALRPAAERALSHLAAMRRREGAALAKDMRTRLSEVAKNLKMIEKRAPEVVEKYRTKLTRRIAEVSNSAVHDSVRLDEEIAIMAERSDISEECTRLSSHLAQYRSTLSEKLPVGKKLNFILQEMNREINTIASKAAEVKISPTVIRIKEEIEKLREQVQNVE